jgi:hypothetical protein
MHAIRGSEDLTLVQFLMSCASTGEVAEYISCYLGRSPEVSAFTSEFLRRKYAEAAGKKARAPFPLASPWLYPGFTPRCVTLWQRPAVQDMTQGASWTR